MLNIIPSENSKIIQANARFYPVLFPPYKFCHTTRQDHTVQIKIRKYEIIFQNRFSYLEIWTVYCNNTLNFCSCHLKT